MSLEEKLQAMRSASAEKVSPEVLSIMQRSKQMIAESGVLQGVIKVGEQLPDFTLNDASGDAINLKDLRQQGAVLITHYRGVW